MQTIALSETALAVLRFRAKKWPMKVRERDLPGYRELIAAGIMEPDGEEFKFTEDGWARREELISEAQDRIERERFDPPDASNLSESARERDGDWYVGRLMEVPGVFSQGESLDKLRENIQEAYELMVTQDRTAAPPIAERQDVEVEV
jgi:predicted RNase H-like HicB family nuclease